VGSNQLVSAIGYESPAGGIINCNGGKVRKKFPEELNEKKFKKMEKERSNALEMAAQENEERKEIKG